MSLQKYSISAFFPAYNDAQSIEKIIRATAALLPTLADEYEIVVVNDGSADETGKVLDSAARKYPFLKVIHHKVNRGYGAALISGFSNCTKDLIFYTDGDGQYDVRELPKLIEAFARGADVVNGYKMHRSDPVHRILAGKLYQQFVRILFRLKVSDVDCDFRLFRRSLLDRIHLRSESGMICVEMMRKFQDHRCRILEIAVHHYAREYGRSQFFTFKHLSHLLKQLFSLWWMLIGSRILSRRADLKKTDVKSRTIPDAF
jgi:glycosyltransferase involved in cell wall biosynthesis